MRPLAFLALLWPLFCLLTVGGCAPALRRPPTLAQLAGPGKRHTPEEVDGLLAEAGNLFAHRDLPSVRQAVATWLAAAAADETRTEGLVGAARGGVYLAEHETDRKARIDAVTSAVAASQLCLAARPDSPACSYWLGASLGLEARERPSIGLSALPRIKGAFENAAALEPLLEDAGPDRALALLYLRAPGWPVGPGDPDRGLEHARRAVELRPDYPPNQLALGEALEATEQGKESQEAYQKALDLALSRSLTGDPDAAEWVKEAREAMRAL